MLADEYHRFKTTLDENHIIFSFCGYVSERILFAIGDTIKQKLAIESADEDTTKKVFSVFVEQVQNIIRYSADKISAKIDPQVQLSSGLIAVGVKQDRFFVVCANVVDAGDVPALRERLTHLQGLTKQEMRAFYKEKLREDAELQSQGATIGLIEIARRSSEPLHFDFKDIGNNQAFFCLETNI